MNDMILFDNSGRWKLIREAIRRNLDRIIGVENTDNDAQGLLDADTRIFGRHVRFKNGFTLSMIRQGYWARWENDDVLEIAIIREQEGDGGMGGLQYIEAWGDSVARLDAETVAKYIDLVAGLDPKNPNYDLASIENRPHPLMAELNETAQARLRGVLELVDVDAQGWVIGPGKFEGEQWTAVLFYHLLQEGSWHDNDDFENGEGCAEFEIKRSELADFGLAHESDTGSWLSGRYNPQPDDILYVQLCESGDGFVSMSVTAQTMFEDSEEEESEE